MTLTLEEQERQAYLAGDTARADTLAQLIDAHLAIDDAMDNACTLQEANEILNEVAL